MAESLKTLEGTHSDYEGAKLGMWFFLFTELMLFGGMFVLYAVYRSWHIPDFRTASEELSRTIGTINTLVLLTSSLFIALSIHFIKAGRVKLAKLFLALTILMGVLFLVDKVFEWGAKFEHQIYPNSQFLLKRGQGEILFYGLYFMMTGLHALHVLAGIIVLLVMMVLIIKGRINENRFVLLENAGLYWHFVDIIWVFLFPLFYLIV